jgi:hypothetical protein
MTDSIISSALLFQDRINFTKERKKAAKLFKSHYLVGNK